MKDESKKESHHSTVRENAIATCGAGDSIKPSMKPGRVKR
jgi:hypothetical protein